LSKFAEPKLLTRKIEQRNMTKVAIRVDKAKMTKNRKPKRDDSDNGSYYQKQGKKRENDDEQGME
jgi:hypothetical protein